MEERAADILAIWEERRDITLEELRLALADKGMAVSVAGLHRFFVRRGLTRKKTGHAIEQDRPDVLKQRQDWFEGNSISNRSAWSSSTKPGLRPI
jgi:transposase